MPHPSFTPSAAPDWLARMQAVADFQSVRRKVRWAGVWAILVGAYVTGCAANGCKAR